MSFSFLTVCQKTIMSFNPVNICIIFPFCFGVSLVLITLGIWQRQKSKVFLKTAKKTRGDIIDYEPRPTLTNTPTLCALVRFVTDRGEEKLHRAKFGPPWTSNRPGEQVEILYNPNNPKEARINTYVELSMLWDILLYSGVFLFIFSLFWLAIMLLQKTI